MTGHWSQLWYISLLTLMIAIILKGEPQVDLFLASLFYDPVTQTFPLRHSAFWQGVRNVLMYAPYVLFVLAALKIGWNLMKDWHGQGNDRQAATALLFLVSTLIFAPALMANGHFKEISSRPRPAHITEFGGKAEFKPFHDFSGSCQSNCSFLSGEVSAAAWTMSLALLVPPPMRTAAVVASLTYTTATGALRMAFGGHFFTDVMFAALFTWMIVITMRVILILRRPH
jgi:lipid A 4'-phosphatase